MTLTDKQTMQLFHRAEECSSRGDYEGAKDLYRALLEDSYHSLATVHDAFKDRMENGLNKTPEERAYNLKMVDFLEQTGKNISNLLKIHEELEGLSFMQSVEKKGSSKSIN